MYVASFTISYIKLDEKLTGESESGFLTRTSVPLPHFLPKPSELRHRKLPFKPKMLHSIPRLIFTSNSSLASRLGSVIRIRKPISDWFVRAVCLTPLNATLNRIPAQGLQARPGEQF